MFLAYTSYRQARSPAYCQEFFCQKTSAIPKINGVSFLEKFGSGAGYAIVDTV
ncbi:hypothetical protein [Nostoc sp.]|uniref:hypothetical protein n=1 Tax=Nostoc sp. TaxID=1180 RepID=UPI002FF72252